MPPKYLIVLWHLQFDYMVCQVSIIVGGWISISVQAVITLQFLYLVQKHLDTLLSTFALLDQTCKVLRNDVQTC